MNAHPDCEPNSEFSDMVSRCDVIWSELPFVEPEQIDKILGVLPF